MEADFSELDGLFPRVDGGERELDPSELWSNFDTFVNYAGVEHDNDVALVLEKYTQAKRKLRHNLRGKSNHWNC